MIITILLGIPAIWETERHLGFVLCWGIHRDQDHNFTTRDG